MYLQKYNTFIFSSIFFGEKSIERQNVFKNFKNFQETFIKTLYNNGKNVHIYNKCMELIFDYNLIASIFSNLMFDHFAMDFVSQKFKDKRNS